MKKTAALMGALLLSAAAMPVLAQQFDLDDETDEGKPHLNMGPDRDVTRACKAEAAQKSLSGKEKRSYVSQCQKREPAPSSGPSGGGMTVTGAARTLTPMRDADGRYPPQNVVPSHFVREGPSPPSAKPAIPDVDAEGRPRPR